VACKEWNGIEADGLELSGFSYDNTMALGHSTWRHVKFVEGTPQPGIGGNDSSQVSWEFSSDVCKHCEVAGCLEACPTGALVRTEFGGVFLQPDICNGCGHCVISCPFGVVQKNEQDGRAFNAPSAPTGKKPAFNRRVRRRVRRSPSNSAYWTICGPKLPSGSRSFKIAACKMRSFTIRSIPASAESTRSS
jgi:Fe-S-cluster-containing dehydrogenase component